MKNTNARERVAFAAQAADVAASQMKDEGRQVQGEAKPGIDKAAPLIQKTKQGVGAAIAGITDQGLKQPVAKAHEQVAALLWARERERV